MPEIFDLIVVGAGINGSAIARDAALRGLRVLLVEKADLCNGTSAWSTRLIHGGLRYLEYAELHLVRESLREREMLLRNAPHLVGPMPLAIPLYKGQKRGPGLIFLGMLAYDILSFDKTLPWHRMMSAEKTRQAYPGLASDNLKGAAVYYDAQVQYAERLVVENALDASRAGAVVLTYAQVEEIRHSKGRVSGLRYRSLADDSVHEVEGRVICNVTGPWVDQTLQTTGLHWPRLMGGTKGSHMVVNCFPGCPQGDGLYVEAQADGRPFFILPWNEQILIGTTDLRTEESLDDVKASREECEYLLREANLLFPQAHLGLEHISFTYSGVRPLPYTPAGSTSAITRRHQVLDHGPELAGLYSVVGGKLTTYRSLAEQAVDKFCRYLARPRGRCLTAMRPLPGCTLAYKEPYLSSFAVRHGVSEKTARHLNLVYGQRSEAVMELARAHEDLAQVICEQTGALAAEVVHAFQNEMASSLSDVLLRRSMLTWRPGLGEQPAKAAASVMVKHLGRSEAQAQQQLETYARDCQRFQPPSLASR